MDDMTTDNDYDAHAATYNARPRAVDDVEGGYVFGRVSDGYACSLDAATRNATPRRASDGLATQTQQAGRMSDTGFDEGYAHGCVSDYAPSRVSEADCRRAAESDGQAVQNYQREMMCVTDADFVDDRRARPADVIDGYAPDAGQSPPTGRSALAETLRQTMNNDGRCRTGLRTPWTADLDAVDHLTTQHRGKWQTPWLNHCHACLCMSTRRQTCRLNSAANTV